MGIRDFDIGQYIVQLKDVWGMESLFGEGAHDDPADGFQVNVEGSEPEMIELNFYRNGDDRQIMIEQQGDAIAIYIYPNQSEIEEKIIIKEGTVVTGPNSRYYKKE